MRTTTAKTLSLAAISLLLLTGCQGKEELPAIPDPTTASTTASTSADATESTEATGEATGSTEATAEATASETQNYSGGSKAPEGEYRPADEHGPAQNVPKPVEPEGMNVESKEGLFKFLTYWNDSVNYGIQTGDFSYASPLIGEEHEVDIEFFAWTENLYNHGGWTAKGLRTVVAGDDLLVSHGNGLYTWGGNLIVEDAYTYYNGEMNYDDNSHTENEGVYFEIMHKDGRWKMLGIHGIED